MSRVRGERMWKVQRWSCILWGEGRRSINERIHIKNGDMVELYDESNTSIFHHFLSKLRYFMIKLRRFQQQLTTGEAKDGTQECVDITCLVWKQNEAPPSSLISSDLRWPSCYSSEEAPDKTSRASNLYTNHQPDPGQDCILVVFNLRFVCLFFPLLYLQVCFLWEQWIFAVQWDVVNLQIKRHSFILTYQLAGSSWSSDKLTVPSSPAADSKICTYLGVDMSQSNYLITVVVLSTPPKTNIDPQKW